MEPFHTPSGQQDLLTDLDEFVVLKPAASRGQRFANYLVDLIITYIIAFGFLFAAAVLMELGGADSSAMLDQTLVNYLVVYASLVFYTALMEAFNKGRTLGKLITGTYAVKTDGKAVDFGTALKRGLCRIVPFEPFSAFGEAPWHDRWTNTTVVKK
ncbi:MAG TPA: RDD family protein [Chitinophaga sp.]|uniref:RDD family protein n=1 Tax=Chitinophaga sp. TaxID=1869181 RepID=UPI002DBC8841|nr:RDD family protein [Chitinophaga sp.]HEU4552814.1 RDD family protein [Chitinophaga sp.]